MMRYLISITVIGLLATSCKKESPFVSKEVIDSLVAAQNPVPENICFVYDNDIYFLDRFDASVEQITASPSVTKTMVKMSYDHQKFAYKNSSGIIEIIDRQGNLLDQLNAYPPAKSFDWSADNATLYMLTGSFISYYGPPLQVPSVTIPTDIPPGANIDIVDLSVSRTGDLAYIVKWQTFDDGSYLMVTKKNDGTNTENIYDVGWDPLRYVRFSANEQDLVLGYESAFNSVKLGKIELFKNLSNYPEMTFESSEIYTFPIFRGDQELLVTGFENESNYVILSRTLFDYPEKDKLLDSYSSATPVYFDWK